MAALLQGSGYAADSDPARADVLIVNTCGFIGPAKEESLRVLRELSEAKRPGQILLAAGCLTQRYGAEVIAQAPGVDGVLGTRRWADVVEVVRALRHGDSPKPVYHLPEPGPVVMESPGIPRWAVQGASAYVKIADGCRRPCAFCAIPLIKGTAVSRDPQAILREAAELDRRGVHEVNLIAQDTTDYGWDLGLKDGLAILLEGLLRAAPSIEWFRILYAYPGYVTDRLIDTMAANPRLIPYLDMPLQHAHPDTLRRMRRPANVEWVHARSRRGVKCRSGAAHHVPCRLSGETEPVHADFAARCASIAGCVHLLRFPALQRAAQIRYRRTSGERRDRLMSLQRRSRCTRIRPWSGARCRS
jgi:ribosomal protein S12 methylthiotransferase